MEFKVKTQKANTFFERSELVIEAKDNATPSYAAIKAEVAKKLKVGEELVVVKRVDQQFGMKDVTAEVQVYNSPEAMKKYEVVKVKKAAGAASAK